MKAKRQKKPRINKMAIFKDFGYEPHPGQVEVHSSRAPRRIVACGVRWGKTLCAAIEGLAAALEPNERSMGWIVAPTYDLADKVFREIVVIAHEHLQHRIITMRESDRRLVIRNLSGGISEIRGKSADNPVSLLGEGLDWLIVDEAARLKPLIWESHLSQRLIDKKGWALLISTPKGKGWFYDLFRKGQSNDRHFQSWNLPSTSNPHLDAKVINEERNRLPERVFLQEYGGQFLEGAGQVFRNVRECATEDWKDADPKGIYYAGLDLAKINDYTVLVIIDHSGRVVFTDRFHRVDWSIQVARVKAATDRYNGALVNTDTTGVGEPVFEALRTAGVRCMPYPFTQKSKAALVNNLALMLEKNDLALPKPDLWPEGIDELEAFEFSVSDSGNVRTNAPSGYHDDCVVALALAAWIVKRRAGRPSITWL